MEHFVTQLQPYHLSYERLCWRWANTKAAVGQIREQFLYGKGSHYLFLKLQDYSEECEQLNRLLTEINRMEKANLKKLKVAS